MVETRSMAKKRAQLARLQETSQHKPKTASTNSTKKVIKSKISAPRYKIKTAFSSCPPSFSTKTSSTMPSDLNENESIKVKNTRKGGILTSTVSFIYGKLSRKPSPNSRRERQNVVINYTCAICLNDFPSSEKDEYFKPVGCKHKTCTDCIRNYFELAATGSLPLQKTYNSIQCPGLNCKGKLYSKDVLPRIFYNDENEISNWWAKVLEKKFIKNKIMCPFKDCRAVFDADMALSTKCTFAECLECNRGICSACQAVWHHGVIKIMNTENETMQTIMAAKKNNWSRCPTCHHVVLKSEGCHNIHCRCGTNFCYRCGGLMKKHNMCNNKCYSYTEQQLDGIRKKMFEKRVLDIPFTVAV